MKRCPTYFVLILLLYAANLNAQQPILPTDPGFTPIATNLVQLTADGTLSYTPDSNRNTIIDHGMVGYRQGLFPIPDVPVVRTLRPSTGDRTAGCH